MIIECKKDIQRNTIVQNKKGCIFYLAQRVGDKYKDFYTLINLDTGWSVVETSKQNLINSGYRTVGTNITYKYIDKERDTRALPILLGDLINIAGKLCMVCTHNGKIIIIVLKTGYFIQGGDSIPETMNNRFKLVCRNSNVKIEYSLT